MSTQNSNLAQNLESLLDTSIKTYSKLLTTGIESLSQLKIPTISENCISCPPKEECPPKFIGKIFRKAMPGEKIIIPFTVQNQYSDFKTYRIGIRELKDPDGDPAPSQPVLNKTLITLPPYGSERILLGISLSQFSQTTYSAEIVIRENLYNQNILLILEVGDFTSEIVVPLDEKKYQLKWQSWKIHFYCEKPTGKNN